MENETYEKNGTLGGRRIEDCEPESTLTFEPHLPVASSTPLAHSAPPVDNNTNRGHTDNDCNNISSNHGKGPASHLQHQRQQSAPAFSSLSPLHADTGSRSSVRGAGHVRHHSQEMPLTGDGRVGKGGVRRLEHPPGRTSAWLEPGGGGFSPDMTSKFQRAAAGTDGIRPTSSSSSSRFSFLSSITTRLTSTAPAPPTPREVDDELCNMDVEAALYPPSSSPAHTPKSAEAFSPAAYKNLQMNAAGLLRRMQEAYRQRVASVRELEAEREAQREEAEEAELRVRSLRTQLEAMAVQASHQEDEMQRLVSELRAERERAEMEREKERRGRPRHAAEDACLGDGEEREYAAEESEEDRQMWGKRKSAGTVRSDLSIDTTSTTATTTTDGESIFSRSRSPTAMTSATDSDNLEMLTIRGPVPPAPAAAAAPPPTLNVPRAAPKPATSSPQPQPQPQLSAFQKLVKGISGGAEAATVSNCSNCRGRDSSVAWDTVSLLRDENRGLKQRVSELEVVLEGALDAVNGVGL
ncbi:hypothetical protein GGS23DRAFT_457996 [Durotheca rogersii]|uniref:uncharacterized protein n=1 Tax=Durotheca rogersii TaxID=419775 RepID=UPI0022210623|nr:uncharacterized protein GGS23DRAFT_457996 [Durotheca rogersii]KAI5864645.1 hypothetical protein GGS23DRAFT_457996 [Durotheca rogersii]